MIYSGWLFLKEHLARLRASLSARNSDHEFDQEVEQHLALLTDRFVQRGFTPEEARLEAKKQFGGVMKVKTEYHERNRFSPLENVVQDSVYVLRQFRKSPLFAIAAILTLALGIGVNTAIFTLVDQLVLRLLPVKDPQTIVTLVGLGDYYGSNMGHNALSYTMYQTIRDRNDAFTNMMCRRSEQFTITANAGSDILRGEIVSGNYFPLLGVRPAMGRLFSANDDLRPGEHPVAVLSHGYWRSRFAGSKGVLGSTILVNNVPLTVIGVSEPGFNGLEPGVATQLFVPLMMTPQLFVNTDFTQIFDARLRWLNVYGRLKPGYTVARAKASLQPLFHQILQAEILDPSFGRATPYIRQHFLKMWMDVIPGGQGNTELRRRYQAPLVVLMGATGFVLLIVCANLASLLSARAATRRKEIAIRLAIGSSRFRIMQQLVTESLILALVGGAAGLGLAVVMVKGLLAFLPPNQAGYTLTSHPDWRILCFAFALCVLTGLLFGLAPALQATNPNLAETLKATAANVTGGSSQLAFRKILVAAQIALSMVLLIGAGLFVRSLTNLHSVDPGFQTQSLVQFDVDVNSIGYDQQQARAFYDRLRIRLQQMPGVAAIGYANNQLLSGSDWRSGITVEGRENKPGEDRLSYVNRVSDGYFRTVGIRLLAGRVFDPRDTETTPKVVVVNESFAKHYFGKQSVLGRRVGRGSDPNTPTDMTIVGVVNDTNYEDLRQQAPRQIYLCVAQGNQFSNTVYMKTVGDGRTILASARRVVADIEPRAPVSNVKTLQQQVEESLATESMITSLSTGFSLLGTALSVLGLYGVMALMVTQRAREIAIRIALGALFGNVVWLVMREVLLLVIVSVAIALPLAFGLARLVQSQLFGVQATDPASAAAAVALLSVVAIAAGYIPARRAASADPIKILRYE